MSRRFKHISGSYWAYCEQLKEGDPFIAKNADGTGHLHRDYNGQLIQTTWAPDYLKENPSVLGKYWIETFDHVDTERVKQLQDQKEQLQVQLAGCLMAAEGNSEAKEGDYGWSPAYQAVVELRRKYNALINVPKFPEIWERTLGDGAVLRVIFYNTEHSAISFPGNATASSKGFGGIPWTRKSIQRSDSGYKLVTNNE